MKTLKITHHWSFTCCNVITKCWIELTLMSNDGMCQVLWWNMEISEQHCERSQLSYLQLQVRSHHLSGDIYLGMLFLGLETYGRM